MPTLRSACAYVVVRHLQPNDSSVQGSLCDRRLARGDQLVRARNLMGADERALQKHLVFACSVQRQFIDEVAARLAFGSQRKPDRPGDFIAICADSPAMWMWRHAEILDELIKGIHANSEGELRGSCFLA